jgi:hypothetical protein
MPKSKISSPTKGEIFGPDFPFGHNVPQDSQDSQELHGLSRITRLSSTFKEKQGDFPPSKEKGEALASLDPGDFDLCDWVKLAYASHQEQPEEDREHWQSPLFYFARFVKAHPAVSELSDHEAMVKVEKLLQELDKFPSSADPWKLCFPEAADGDAARLDFMVSWNAVRHVPFRDVLANALTLADKRPLAPPYERGRLYKRFISLAGWLQVLLAGKPILLPTRKVADLLGCDQRTVSRLRKLGIEDELLIPVKEHCYRSGGRSEATEFRFAIEHFPELSGRR